MKIFVAIAALILTAALSTAATTPPNFIVILTDDQGWGTTSVMMDPSVPESKSDFFQTPNIEKLAAAGMRFSQAYAHCNCSPSRASIQTGRSPAALHFTDIAVVARDRIKGTASAGFPGLSLAALSACAQEHAGHDDSR